MWKDDELLQSAHERFIIVFSTQFTPPSLGIAYIIEALLQGHHALRGR